MHALVIYLPLCVSLDLCRHVSLAQLSRYLSADRRCLLTTVATIDTADCARPAARPPARPHARPPARPPARTHARTHARPTDRPTGDGEPDTMSVTRRNKSYTNEQLQMWTVIESEITLCGHTLPAACVVERASLLCSSPRHVRVRRYVFTCI